MSHLVLAVDPGKETGVALLYWSGNSDDMPIKKISSEVPPEEFAGAIDLVLDGWKTIPDTLHVVCERFLITTQTAKNSQAPFSLEQIGVLKHLCRVRGFDVGQIVFQTPVDAKTMFSNDILKKIDIWHRGGEGHANDAIRHALLRLVKIGWKPKVLLD